MPSADKCLFLNPSLAERTAVIIWVDDFIFMDARFTIPTTGNLVTFLGMDIKYDVKAKTMFISQANSIETLLERADCKLQSCPTPCATGLVFTKQDCQTSCSLLSYRVSQFDCSR